MSLANIKQSLRMQMKTRRDAVENIARKRAEVAISNNFMGNIPFSRHDVIGFYWPIGSEINITLMAEALIEQGHECVLPVIVDKDSPLIFRLYHKGQDLQANSRFHVMEPPSGAKQKDPTIIIVPLLAFDILGHRLGYGGGFYDRTLELYKKKSNFVSVGIAYDFMQIPKVPAEEHDQRLDCVVTDKRVVVCS